MNKFYSANTVLLLAAAALLSLASCKSPSGNSGKDGAASYPASTALLDGTWFREEQRSEDDTDPNATTYHYAETWIINGTNWEWDEAKTQYSDAGSDINDRRRGTFTYRASDGILTFTTAEEKNDAATVWTATTDDPMAYRNLLVSGKWYQDTWARIGSGSGLVGTWESIPLGQSGPPSVVKSRYVFTSSTLTYSNYAIGESGAITGDPLTTPASTSYTVNGNSFTVGSGGSATFKIVGGSNVEIVGTDSFREFTKQ